jgi:hypothetical protein
MSSIRGLTTYQGDRHVYVCILRSKLKLQTLLALELKEKYMNSKAIEVLERDICVFLAGFCNMYQSQIYIERCSQKKCKNILK